MLLLDNFFKVFCRGLLVNLLFGKIMFVCVFSLDGFVLENKFVVVLKLVVVGLFVFGGG